MKRARALVIAARSIAGCHHPRDVVRLMPAHKPDIVVDLQTCGICGAERRRHGRRRWSAWERPLLVQVLVDVVRGGS